MSKQSEAKEIQGYDSKPISQTCQNCACFRFDTVFLHEYLGKKYYTSKNKRCSLGGFAVKKTATCKQFRYQKDDYGED